MSLELALGIVGTITGILALAIHFIRLRREKPRLKAEVIECSHSFRTKKDGGVDRIYIKPIFKITNLGDRGTNISDVRISFTVNDKKYSDKEAEYWSADGPLPKERRWVNAHETIEICPRFEFPYDEESLESIECLFIVQHPHRKEIIKTTSKSKS